MPGAGTHTIGAIDGSTASLQTVDYPHHEIHGGSRYVLTQRTAVDAFDIAAPLSFYVITPNTTKWAHLVIYGDANAPAYWELFEDDGNASNFDVSGGSAATPTNRNRNSANTSGLTITTAPTITKAEAAVLISTEAIAKSSSAGTRHEWILAQNTEYLVRATSYVDNNEGSISLDWYEHTDK